MARFFSLVLLTSLLLISSPSFPPTPFTLLHEKMFSLGSWVLFDLMWQLAWFWMGRSKAFIARGASMWKGLMGSHWMLMCVHAKLRGGVVQEQSSRKNPQWQDPWAGEGEQSQLLGSLPELTVRRNWSIRSSTSRPPMADWRCDFCPAHQSQRVAPAELGRSGLFSRSQGCSSIMLAANSNCETYSTWFPHSFAERSPPWV